MRQRWGDADSSLGCRCRRLRRSSHPPPPPRIRRSDRCCPLRRVRRPRAAVPRWSRRPPHPISLRRRRRSKRRASPPNRPPSRTSPPSRACDRPGRGPACRRHPRAGIAPGTPAGVPDRIPRRRSVPPPRARCPGTGGLAPAASATIAAIETGDRCQRGGRWNPFRRHRCRRSRRRRFRLPLLFRLPPVRSRRHPWRWCFFR
mmetsp:Transcript_779/g.1650  ORF Transcript_779/g.1650 Transcript_779/m.1650 type:complete len:202 (-) Transcript_779:319-924(-)